MLSGGQRLLVLCTHMKGINSLHAIREQFENIQKKITRLFDYDAEKFESSPYDDWYRLLWITILLASLLALLHAYVWMMVLDIADDEGERLTAPHLVSEEELLRAVSAQAGREKVYGELLGATRTD